MTQRFYIGNFNVRNLIPASTSKGYHFFYGADKRNSYWGEGKGEQNQYQQKIKWLARQLDRLSCDIVCFEEVFDLQPLQDVIAASAYAGKVNLVISGEAKYREETWEGNQARIHLKPRIALMVHKDFKIESTSTLEQFPEDFDFSKKVKEYSGRTWQLQLTQSGEKINKFTHPLLRTVIRLPTRFNNVIGKHKKPPQIVLYTAHLKSKRPIQVKTRSDDLLQAGRDYLGEFAIGQARSLLLRAIEAAALRKHILKDLTDKNNRPVFLLGDLNDGPRGITTDIAGGLSRKTISAPAERKEKLHLSADLALYSAYDLQTQKTHRDIYFTHIYEGFHDTLDHVMVSSHFVPRAMRDGHGTNNIGKVGTLRVFNDHLLNAEIDDMRTDKVGKYLHTRSDHGLVSVRIDWFES